MIFTPSNFLSLLRGPLALLFAIDSTLCRSIAVFLAIASDVLDGYLARRYRMTSQIGACLDPLMDKFFVFFAVGVLMREGKFASWEAVTLLSRDFAILTFALYLAVKGKWSNFQFRSIWAGKVTTTLQFFVLLGITNNLIIPAYLFWCFVVLGVLALFELYFIEHQIVRSLD